MAFPAIQSLQLSTQLEYLIKQLRWNQTVANDFLVTLDSVQLYTGLGPPILELPTPQIKYAGNSFILSLHEQLAHIGASLWIEDKWSHPLQRENDAFIMDRFLTIPGITTAQLYQANSVRIYLRILTMSDLAEPSGKFIPDSLLTGEWQGGSDLYWPHQILPPKKHWATFRACLQKSFCSEHTFSQPAHYGMDLDTPLGKWYPVKRHSWFNVYKSPTTLFWRPDTVIHTLKPVGASGFYIASGTVSELPLDCHSIRFQLSGKEIWTQRGYNMTHPSTPPMIPPGLTSFNSTRASPTGTLRVGCDASLHPSHRVATCAWVLETSDSTQLHAHANISNISSVTTYRSELEGIYRSLYHIRFLAWSPSHIQQWCDNKAAINNSALDLVCPSKMTNHADILLAIAALRHKFSCPLLQTHVYGHQDVRRDDQIPPPASPLSI